MVLSALENVFFSMYAEDSFNLYGLRTLPKFGTALRTILGELPAGSAPASLRLAVEGEIRAK